MSQQGPVHDMVERRNKRTDHHAPPYLKDLRPQLMKSGATVLALICADPRVEPAKVFDLENASGPVSIVSIPGGRAEHAVNSLAAMQAALNCSTIVVVHHTDCGMTHLTDRDVQDYLISIDPEEEQLIRSTKFGEIRGSLEQSLEHDLNFLRASPWIKKETRLVGLKYDLHKGTLEEVLDLKPAL